MGGGGVADTATGGVVVFRVPCESKSVDTPVPRLVGRSPAEIEAEMLAFRTGQKPASVMNRIAKGFSDAEIKAIAAWYGAQKD